MASKDVLARMLCPVTQKEPPSKLSKTPYNAKRTGTRLPQFHAHCSIGLPFFLPTPPPPLAFPPSHCSSLLPLLCRYTMSFGLFGLAGGVTNWVAVYMLFEKVPYLYGSGVIPTRYVEIRSVFRLRLLSREGPPPPSPSPAQTQPCFGAGRALHTAARNLTHDNE